MKASETTYKEIEFDFGSIENAIKLLKTYKDKGEFVFGTFNGVKLYSDIDNLDSAYQKITGKNKAEFDLEQKRWHEEHLEKKRIHKERIPELTKEWIEKGNNILDAQYHELWAECVPIRLGDLYEGMELGASLDIISPLNKGCTFEEAKEIIDKQGHSGMSYGLVRSMVMSFCDRGKEFAEYLSKLNKYYQAKR
jgi:hypothetical protein